MWLAPQMLLFSRKKCKSEDGLLINTESELVVTDIEKANRHMLNLEYPVQDGEPEYSSV